METGLTMGMVLSGLFFGWTIGSHYQVAEIHVSRSRVPLTARLLRRSFRIVQLQRAFNVFATV
ncbi:hypothetical protein [Caballeronia arationis]|uniref:hypothetical protein n=1 Tax=Caballeronia arationis TaxID=1777142 RepID=UPI000787E68D|nr:hypothetical protein [Caballeronia arationis]